MRARDRQTHHVAMWLVTTIGVLAWFAGATLLAIVLGRAMLIREGVRQVQQASTLDDDFDAVIVAYHLPSAVRHL